jgi:16S rRNA (cytosine1402-N4)-methyltransferase
MKKRRVHASPGYVSLPEHVPVLLEPVLDLLLPSSGKDSVIVDATLGLGGHAEAMLQRAGPGTRLVGLDQDASARELASERLEPFGDRVEIRAGNFKDMADLLAGTAAEGGADVILMDIGVSSLQLDEAERGFSFSKDGPLDMRMDPTSGESAAAWINRASQKEIEEVLDEYGEEKKFRAVGRAIFEARPFQRTAQLADAVRKVLGRSRHGEVNPATRTFQAIRLKVNEELEGLTEALPAAIEKLKPGGRLGVISFHSLEDRITKRWFERESRDCVCPPELPACACTHKALVKKVSRKPVMATEEESAVNPRARSARLRVVERLAR